jgi:pilus assembly protein CpaE
VAQFLRIVVATPDQATARLIERVAAGHQASRVVATVDTDVQLLEAVANRRPQLVFVSADLGDMRGFDLADRLSREHPGLYIAMLSPRHTPEEIRRAMKAGARECLLQPPSEDAIQHVIVDALGRNGVTAPQVRGPVFGIMSSKGGVGKSTVSVNLAIAMKQLTPNARVALVDGDLYFGDVAMLLNVKPDRTIHELNTALDAEIADRFLIRHESGVEVLAAPLRTEQAEEIPAERFRAILRVLQGLYDIVLVDATVSAFDTMLATLDIADVAMLLTTLDVICLKDVSQMLEMLNRLKFPARNVMIVGNRYDERVSLSPKDAERALGLSFDMVLQRDDRNILAANRGVPLISTDPDAPFVQRVVTLAKTLTTNTRRASRVPT